MGRQQKLKGIAGQGQKQELEQEQIQDPKQEQKQDSQQEQKHQQKSDQQQKQGKKQAKHNEQQKITEQSPSENFSNQQQQKQHQQQQHQQQGFPSKRRDVNAIPKRKTGFSNTVSKYTPEDISPPDLPNQNLAVEGALHSGLLSVMVRHSFVDVFLNDSSLESLISETLDTAGAEAATESTKTGLADLCLKLIEHPPNINGTNRVSVMSLAAGMQHHYSSPSVITASTVTSCSTGSVSSPSTSAACRTLFPSPPALSRLLSPLETNVIRLLFKLDQDKRSSDPDSSTDLASTPDLASSPLCLRLMSACHQRLFFDPLVDGQNPIHLLQRVSRLAVALYTLFGDPSSLRVFTLDLLRTPKQPVDDKILLIIANIVALCPHPLLAYPTAKIAYCPLAATLRHVLSSKMLKEEKKQIAPYLKPLHDFLHEWVLPLLPAPPGVIAGHFAKPAFAQNILLQIVLDLNVKSENLVVVSENDVGVSSTGLEFLKCLSLVGRRQGWGWVASVLLEAFCLREMNQLGFVTVVEDEEEEEVSATSPVLTPLTPSSPLPSYRRALFLLFAIPHLVAAPTQPNTQDTAIVAIKLCQALENACSASSAAPSAPGALTRVPWEAQLVLAHVLCHFVFIESGKGKKGKKRVVDAIFHWMETNSGLLQKFCPANLKDRLTNVLLVKKAL